MLKFHGTEEEAGELIRALEANCQYSQSGGCGTDYPTCSVHSLSHDQRALDRLLFARRCREVWIAEEWAPWRPWDASPEDTEQPGLSA